jgi:hypothetical protein
MKWRYDEEDEEYWSEGITGFFFMLFFMIIGMPVLLWLLM